MDHHPGRYLRSRALIRLDHFTGDKAYTTLHHQRRRRAITAHHSHIINACITAFSLASESRSSSQTHRHIKHCSLPPSPRSPGTAAERWEPLGIMSLLTAGLWPSLFFRGNFVKWMSCSRVRLSGVLAARRIVSYPRLLALASTG